MQSTVDITALLVDWRSGRQEALDALFPLIHDELRQRAHFYLQQERAGHTLSTTDLVHETYLKLVDIERVQWQDRVHFMAVAARAMRRVLVSYARQHRAEKRWGGKDRLSLDDVPLLSAERSEEMLALDEALETLDGLNPRLSRTVELRFFGGLTIEETAAVLDVAPSTVKLDWQKARAWLYRALHT